MQLADSTLQSFQADAHGFLAFLGQFGEGMIIPPKVVQSEELALSIAWWQPDRSVQRLVGRRDTTMLPGNVGYYRDRYRVVMDNLPDRIRLGDGQDTRDVPHPLAYNADSIYEYVAGDSLRIGLPDRDILVDEVKFRPRNPAMPAAVGSIYLDRETAAVVRLSMTFTRAAIRDKRIETLVITLENGLVNGRYWLPRRQEVEVSRGSTWFDIPARGIVRGHWEIGNYTVNERVPAAVAQLPQWSSVSSDSLRSHPFEGRVVDVLPPEMKVASSEDVKRARIEAAAAVQASLLTRPARASVSGRGVSDFLRYNRAEGLALGIGGTHRANGIQVSARVRYGFSDRQLKGSLVAGMASAFNRMPNAQLFIEREYRDVSSRERAGVTNSLAAGVLGSDYTMLVDTRSAGLLWRHSPDSRFRWRLAFEEDRPTSVNATSLSGSFMGAPEAWILKGARLAVDGAGGWVQNESRSTSGLWQVNAGVGAYRGEAKDIAADIVCCVYLPRTVRPVAMQLQGELHVTRSWSDGNALFLRTAGGLAAGRDLPPQWLLFAGGTWSAPGYAVRQFGSRAFLSQRAEWRTRIPAPSIPLGKYGRSPAHATVAPFVQVLATSSGLPSRPLTPGLYPSVGVGALFFYDLVRVDAARGLRHGEWRFSIDVDRSFWGIL